MRHLFQYIDLPKPMEGAEHVESPGQDGITMLCTDRLRCAGSTSIEKIGYGEANATLEIQFHSGGRYRYQRVPRTLFEQMVEADSIGKFYHQNIKGKFASEKL